MPPFAAPNDFQQEPPCAPPRVPSSGTGGREAIGGRSTLRRLLVALRPHVLLIAVMTLLTARATAFLVSREAPGYRARALVQVVDSRNVLPRSLGGQAAEQSGAESARAAYGAPVVLDGIRCVVLEHPTVANATLGVILREDGGYAAYGYAYAS